MRIVSELLPSTVVLFNFIGPFRIAQVIVFILWFLALLNSRLSASSFSAASRAAKADWSQLILKCQFS